VLSDVKNETIEVGVVDLVDTNLGMGTMDIRSVIIVATIDLMNITNLVEKKVANLNEN
jgi:hypothetical protein